MSEVIEVKAIQLQDGDIFQDYPLTVEDTWTDDDPYSSRPIGVFVQVEEIEWPLYIVPDEQLTVLRGHKP